MPMQIRAAEPTELDLLAKLWYDAWQDAHARILPEALARLRTLENFRERLQADFAHVRVAGAPGAPIGFCVVKKDELYQLFVSAAARGTGIAAALLADGELRLAADGVATAWLACAIGNERAARFYEKHGWHRVGTTIKRLDPPEKIFPLEVWRDEKILFAEP